MPVRFGHQEEPRSAHHGKPRSARRGEPRSTQQADPSGAQQPDSRAALARFAWLSIATALATIALKSAAYWFTGSVGLLSDALESLVNLAGGVIGLLALTIAARSPDEERPFGYDKAEYFASGAEGALIVLAAVGIVIAAIDRLLHPQSLTDVGWGIGVSIVASALNLLTARVLLIAGRRHQSIALEADAQHLLSDVWTSAGVIVGVGAVMLTGWAWLDPLLAMLVAANIVRTGVLLMRRSLAGLMDSALPAAERALLVELLDGMHAEGVRYHALRTRAAGVRRFVSVHLLVPGEWTVARGHELAERFEQAVAVHWPQATVVVHVEPIDDPRSYGDQELAPRR